MKKIFFVLAMLIGVAYGQTIGYLRYDSVKLAKNGGTTELILENATKAITNGVLVNTGNGRTSFVAPSVPLSSITAATATNSIDNANYGQTWEWNTLTTGSGLILNINGTTAGPGQSVLSVASSGANASPNRSTYAGNFQNSKTGTNNGNYGINVVASAGSAFNKAGVFDASGAATNNYGATFSASGGTNNYAIIVPASSGSVGIGTSAPDSTLHVVGGFKYANGSQGSGKYLTSDANGGATWGDLSLTASSTTTFTNKRWTARVGSTTSSATPTINTDNYDIYKLTAQTADITSMTTNLSGTPVDGDILEVQITGTAARAITWGASFVSSTVTLPTTTVTTATLTVILQYYSTSSYGNNKWVCVNYY